jgi:2'-hydroxyisoflavone reductase
MPLSRRRFVGSSLSALALAAAGTAGAAPSRGKRAGGAPAREKGAGRRILILGGTGFLGPALVEVARARGHTLTLFNRGKTNPQLFPDLEKLRGDRDGKLDALRGRRWDACIDDSGYVPRIVRMSAELLAPSVSRYLFVSSVSVYRDDIPRGADEGAALATVDDPATEDVRAHYGALKALSEKAAEAALQGRAIVVRPGLIVGPGDPTDRFTYWPARLARGGEVLAPGDGSDPVQLVDVRDVAAFLIGLVEREETGTYNAVGPERTLTMGAMLEACRAAAATDAKLTWVPWPFLEKEGVQPWADLPAWIPAALPESAIAAVSNARAIAKGLRFRPIAETARDTLRWWKGLPEERRAKPRAGLAPEKEREVLERWRAAQGAAAKAPGAR